MNDCIPEPAGKAACRELARKIEDMLKNGFAVDERTVHFIDSFFNCPDAPALSAILNDPDEDDHEVLIDQIVSPDEMMIRAVEAVLAQVAFTDEDVSEILSFLPDSLETALRFSDGRGEVRFPVGASALSRFVDQLKITRRIPGEIREALCERFDFQAECLAALAALRHARITFSENRIAFLKSFVCKTTDTSGDEWLADLRQVLAILERQHGHEDVLSGLGAEKENCQQQVAATLRMEKQLAAKNIETVMMQKAGSGVMADKQQLYRRIGFIDRISLKVFGKIPPSDTPQETADAFPVSFSFENGSGRS